MARSGFQKVAAFGMRPQFAESLRITNATTTHAAEGAGGSASAFACSQLLLTLIVHPELQRAGSRAQDA